jgi:hypothetical protein
MQLHGQLNIELIDSACILENDKRSLPQLIVRAVGFAVPMIMLTYLTVHEHKRVLSGQPTKSMCV